MVFINIWFLYTSSLQNRFGYGVSATYIQQHCNSSIVVCLELTFNEVAVFYSGVPGTYIQQHCSGVVSLILNEVVL